MQFETIITNYNYDDYMDEAISCVLNQTIPPTSIIVANDNSHYRSVNHQSEKIIYLDIFEGQGQANALNKSVPLLKGDVVTFLDADDLYPDNYFETLVNVYQTYGQDATYMRPVAFKNQNELTTIRREGRGLKVRYESDLSFLQASPPFWWLGVPTSGISILTKNITKIFPLPNPSDWTIAADQPLCQRINYLSQGVCTIDEPRFYYRIHNRNSFTKGFSNYQIADRDEKYNTSLVDFLQKNPEAFGLSNLFCSLISNITNKRRIKKIIKSYITILGIKSRMNRSQEKTN